MVNRRCATALVSALALFACESPSPTNPTGALTTLKGVGLASIVADSFNLPIEFGNGLASDGHANLYLSTGSMWRDTYVIDRPTRSVVGTIPTGGNPRDVTYKYDLGSANLYFSDLGSTVEKRSLWGSSLASYPLPFRGGALANAFDSLYVGDIDGSTIQVMTSAGAAIRSFDSGLRPEGMVADTSAGFTTLWVITLFDNYLYNIDIGGTLIKKCDSPYRPGAYGLGGIAIADDSLFIAMSRNSDPTQGTTIHVLAIQDLVCLFPAMQMEGDVNLKGGNVRMSLLSDASFDATAVDVGSLRFGRNGTEASVLLSQLHDVDGDGDADLRLHFRAKETGILCGDAAAVLTGKTVGGQAFKSSAAIQTRGCK